MEIDNYDFRKGELGDRLDESAVIELYDKGFATISYSGKPNGRPPNIAIETYREFTNGTGKADMVRVNTREFIPRDPNYTMMDQLLSNPNLLPKDLSMLLTEISHIPKPWGK